MKIQFNNSIFEITHCTAENGIESIKRTTEPFIEVQVEQRQNTLKIEGWKDFKPFTYLNE